MQRERSRTKQILKQFSSFDKINKNIKKSKQEVYQDKKGKKKLEEIKQKIKDSNLIKEQAKADEIEKFPKKLLVQFTSADGLPLKGTIEIESEINKSDLDFLLNKFKASLNQEQNKHILMVDDYEITKTLKDTLLKSKHIFDSEHVVKITYHPENLFSVKPLTRGGNSLEGHSNSILTCQFSPCGKYLATGGGDQVLRIWDMHTYTVFNTIEGHTSWIMNLLWSPDGSKIASGSYDGKIIIFDKEGNSSQEIKPHKQWVTSLAWKPLHLSDKLILVSSGKDGCLFSMNAVTNHQLFNISGHNESITKVIWSGENIIYSSSQDKTIKSWTEEGILIKVFKGHGHWINTMAINTEFVLRTGFYDYGNEGDFTKYEGLDLKSKSEIALQRYNSFKNKLNFKFLDRIVSGSDDFTMILWSPLENDKPIIRMTGHQQLINHVMFSPNSLFIASASFDKSIKLWNGVTGTFLHNFHGHVASIYQISWSSDSKYILSASKDSTVKIWNVKSEKETKSCRHNLPGHADEVYCIDWSPDGENAASGSKDQRVNIWRH